jgi:hypothetical protein
MEEGTLITADLKEYKAYKINSRNKIQSFTVDLIMKLQ